MQMQKFSIKDNMSKQLLLRVIRRLFRLIFSEEPEKIAPKEVEEALHCNQISISGLIQMQSMRPTPVKRMADKPKVEKRMKLK